MKKPLAYKLKMGAFVLGGLVLMLALLAYMGSKQHLFSKTIELYGSFKKVSGLRSGNNVTFSGIIIGVVETVEMVSDTSILVRVQVEKKSAKFIKTDSRMIISPEDLMGNKVINITGGTAEAKSVKDGGHLQTDNPFDIEEVLLVFKSAGSDLAEVANNIKGITEEIKQGNGFAGKILSDPEFAAKMDLAVDRFKESGDNTLAFTRDINALSSDVKNGKGVLGMLLQDDSTATRVHTIIDSLEATTQRASELSRNLAAFSEGMSKDSPLGNLLHDEEMGDDLKQTIHNLEGNTAELNETLETLRESWLVRGLFNKKKEEEKPKTEKPEVKPQEKILSEEITPDTAN